MRWRIERDYLDMKQEVGFGHYEGRGWPGFHHHGTLCITVYGFLISEQETIPPSASRCAWRVKKPVISDSYRPRGAPDPNPTSRSQLDRNAPSCIDERNRTGTRQMSLLRASTQEKEASSLMTQYN
jgi:hypothetical protein